ncbi:MAG: hydroxymethylglutaryl-CoA lyase [Phycisphaerales bacterium JB061]
MADHVRITDVSPRDGLQNEPLRADGSPIPTADKAKLIQSLLTTGVDEIEITSFVSPKWIPQLGDADELCKLLHNTKPNGMSFSALVPNERGMASLLQANEQAGTDLIDKVSVFTAASETFSKKNTNAAIAETLQRFEPVFAQAKEHKLAIRAYVSCVIECPFEGIILPEAVADVSRKLLDMGADEIDLGDTIGAGCTETTAAMLAAVTNHIPPSKLVLHLHDTFGRASECVRAALAAGVRSFDGSAAGLGGCPYASTESTRAPGNIATETLAFVIKQAGYDTRIDNEALAKAATIAQEITA